MRAKQALYELKSFARQQGMALDHLTPRDTADLMLDFYTQVRAEDCAVDEDSDMLLFRWGLEDEDDGEVFEIALTRQFVWMEHRRENGRLVEEESVTWHLSMVLTFLPVLSCSEIGSGSHWCICPEEVPDLRALIASHPGIRFAEHTTCHDFRLTFEQVVMA